MNSLPHTFDVDELPYGKSVTGSELSAKTTEPEAATGEASCRARTI